MRSRVVLASFALVALTFQTAAWAEPGHHDEVRLLGATALSNSVDHDVIRVEGNCPGPRNHPVSALKVRVQERRAHIDYVRVRFGNGQWEQLPIRNFFEPGSESRWVDLPGGRRCIEMIAIQGETEGHHHDREAIVEVYGHE